MRKPAVTASKLLMEILDDFSRSEGKQILVVYTQEDESVVVRTNAVNTHVVGMAEFAKEIAMAELMDGDITPE